MLSFPLQLLLRIGLCLMLAASIIGAPNVRFSEILEREIPRQNSEEITHSAVDLFRRNQFLKMAQRWLPEDLLPRSPKSGIVYQMKCQAINAYGPLLSSYRLGNWSLAPLRI